MLEKVVSKGELKDNELDVVSGGQGDVPPTMPVFWDPLWWYVDRTGHLPTVSVPR